MEEEEEEEGTSSHARLARATEFVKQLEIVEIKHMTLVTLCMRAYVASNRYNLNEIVVLPAELQEALQKYLFWPITLSVAV